MTARQRPWPRQWLMTDERLGNALWAAIARLPDGKGGIVLRHYATEAAERRALAVEIARISQDRGLTLSIAADPDLARELGAELVHNPGQPPGLAFSMAVHSHDQAETARAMCAALIFVSPVYATRSHLGEAPLGPERAAALARAVDVPAIALGGMDAARFAALPPNAFHGWAGIDAWLR
jgi:thiamine-phosphate pyrophosphorylase